MRCRDKGCDVIMTTRQLAGPTGKGSKENCPHKVSLLEKFPRQRGHEVSKGSFVRNYPSTIGTCMDRPAYLDPVSISDHLSCLRTKARWAGLENGGHVRLP